MNVRSYLAAILGLVLATHVDAQGFAGLGQTTDGYALPSADTRFIYPEDHGQHPEFRIEWWYLTANLTDAEGTPYGIQWTLFRNALTPDGHAEDQAWMGHAAVSAPEGHFFAERLARGEHKHAGVIAEPFTAFIDEWRMEGPTLSDINLTAQGAEFAYDLSLLADGPFVVQGANGFSVKSEEGLASHYYSQPFYEISGSLTLPSGVIEVTGKGWLDREWSSQPLTESQTGWDWVSLHMSDGEKLMGYRLRDADGTAYTVGTWISADGTPSPFSPGDITMTAVEAEMVAGRNVPVVWDVSVPSRNLDVRVAAIYPQSWMETTVPYWEGPVTVKGTHDGIGYLEMTGYE